MQRHDRTRHESRAPSPLEPAPAAPFPTAEQNGPRPEPSGLSLVLTEAETARSLRVSVRTLQRLRVEGGGPAFIKLTERRIGYTVSALHAWVAARQVLSTSAATVAKQRAA